MQFNRDTAEAAPHDTFRDHYDTTSEAARRHDLLNLYQQSPIAEPDVLSNLALYIGKSEIARLLYLRDLYDQILDVPGVIMEFGVRWGQNLALFEAFRGIYEPFNRTRKIIGFDTFEGFPAVSQNDPHAVTGELSVTPDYERHLESVLAVREREGPVSHIRRFELVKGDATDTVLDYLDRHPETIISLAYFDMDLYEPTKVVLEQIQPYLTQGSVVAFDELGETHYPGETVAVREAIGLSNVRLTRTRYSSNRAYFVCR